MVGKQCCKIISGSERLDNRGMRLVGSWWILVGFWCALVIWYILNIHFMPNCIQLYFEDEEREEIYELRTDHTLLQVLQHPRWEQGPGLVSSLLRTVGVQTLRERASRSLWKSDGSCSGRNGFYQPRQIAFCCPVVHLVSISRGGAHRRRERAGLPGCIHNHPPLIWKKRSWIMLVFSTSVGLGVSLRTETSHLDAENGLQGEQLQNYPAG